MSLGFNEQSSKASTIPVNMTPAALQRDWGPFARVFGQLMSGKSQKGQSAMGGIPFAPQGSGYNGSNPFAMVAPMSAGEGSMLGALNSQVTDPTQSNYLNKTISGGFLGSNPFLTQAIQAAQRPTQEALDQTLTRDLPGQFGAAGQTLRPGVGSSAFSDAASRVFQTGAHTMGDIAAQMGSADYQNERQMQNQAVGLQQQQTQELMQALQANALPRMIQQQGISTGLQLFQQRISNLLNALGISTGQSGMSNISQASSSQGSGGGFSFGLGNLV